MSITMETVNGVEYTFNDDVISHNIKNKNDKIDNTKQEGIDNLINIINNSDVSSLYEFKEKYPNITLYDSYYSSDNIINPYNYLINNDITDEFIDALINCDLLDNKSIFYLLCEFLLNMNHYNKWNDAFYLFKILDKSIVNTYCVVKNDDIYEPYVIDLLSSFYSCPFTHYYGKIHGEARRFYNMLKSNGVILHDINGKEKEEYVLFWNDEKNIKNFSEENPILFENRNIDYWNCL
jgi:hypothetical protein